MAAAAESPLRISGLSSPAHKEVDDDIEKEIKELDESKDSKQNLDHYSAQNQIVESELIESNGAKYSPNKEASSTISPTLLSSQDLNEEADDEASLSNADLPVSKTSDFLKRSQTGESNIKKDKL